FPRHPVAPAGRVAPAKAAAVTLRAAAYTLREALSSRAALAASLADLRPQRNGHPANRHLAEAVGWLSRAQDAVPGGGGSHGFRLRSGWPPPYPETTGYIITPLLRCTQATHPLGAGLDVADLKARVGRMAGWLTTVQLDCGALPGGTVTVAPSPTVFNTGQVLEGWCAAYRERPEDLRRPITSAAAWLVSVQDDDGCWR